MGSKNPDRIRMPPSPEEALTLAEIHVAGWTLRACCGRCNVQLRADVGVLVKANGPDVIWWGRRPKCPVWDCTGQLTYSARAVASGSWRSMREAAPERLVKLWESRRRPADLGPR